MFTPEVVSHPTGCRAERAWATHKPEAHSGVAQHLFCERRVLCDFATPYNWNEGAAMGTIGVYGDLEYEDVRLMVARDEVEKLWLLIQSLEERLYWATCDE